jgi:hypothetical protein
MRLYEVHDTIREGFRVTQRPGAVEVRLGKDAETGNLPVLPVGNSIAKWLGHPDDSKEQFRLLHAALDEKPHGLYLVAAPPDEKDALVLLHRCCDPELGTTRVAEARGDFTEPEFITSVQGNDWRVDLYRFKAGDGLFMSIPAAVLGTTHPKRFRICLEECGPEVGEKLKQELVMKTSIRRPRVRESRRAPVHSGVQTSPAPLKRPSRELRA